MAEDEQGDLGFSYRPVKSGDVMIDHYGRLATILRGKRAAVFLKKAEQGSFAEQQQLMARATGNYRRGNERNAKNHPRNRG